MTLTKIITDVPFLYEELSSIEGVKLTNRQIDIVACLISHQKRKVVCKILGISLSTFIGHLSKVKLLIQHSVSDKHVDVLEFLETSKKYHFLKNHYVQLLIQHSFEKMLCTIGEQKFISKNCDIQYHVDVNRNNLLNKRLRKHFNLANINFDVNDSSLSTVRVLVIAESILEKSSYSDNLRNDIILAIQENLLTENKSHEDKTATYYDAFFQLLEKVFPEQKIINLYNAFSDKKQAYENNLFNNKIYIQPDLNGAAIKQHKDVRVRFARRILKNNNLIIPTTACLFLIVLGIVVDRVFIIKSHKTIVNVNISPMIVTYLPPRNIRFTGRGDIFKLIENNLNKTNFGVITQAISGSGGIGKTQLAIEYAYKGLADEIYDTVIWLVAENVNSLNQSYNEIAEKSQINMKGLSALQLRSKIHNLLLEQNKSKRVLFILDNVRKQQDIQQYLEELHSHWPVNISPHVLITSRSQDWLQEILILDIFTSEEAYLFVKENLPDAKEENIKLLTKELYNYPLALSQAIAYIKKHTNIKDYLHLYSSKKKQYLDLLPIESDQYKKTLWYVMSITLDGLNDVAKTILYSSAYLATTP